MQGPTMLDQMLISFVLMGVCLFLVCLVERQDPGSPGAAAPGASRRSNLADIAAGQKRRTADQWYLSSVDRWENEGGAVDYGMHCDNENLASRSMLFSSRGIH
jgi:hypothetical protein